MPLPFFAFQTASYTLYLIFCEGFFRQDPLWRSVFYSFFVGRCALPVFDKGLDDMFLRIRTFLSVIGDNFVSAFRSMNGWDVLDIAIVSLLLYYLFFFIRDRRAGKLALGVCTLAIVQILCDAVGLSTTLFLLGYVFEVGLVALVVIFQPELRTLLGKMGGEMIHGLRGSKDVKVINALCTACATLAKDKVGALIVLERSTRLGDIVGSGTVLDAEVSSQLLCNIFQNKAPLHDGAVVIKDGRISAAGCFLPLSASHDVIHNLGTRHRAALGMSEAGDAVVIVVSEETGIISIACNGNLTRNYDYASLQRELARLLGERDAERNLPWWKRIFPFLQKQRSEAHLPTSAKIKEAQEAAAALVRKNRLFRIFAAVASVALSVILWVYATAGI